MLLYTLQEGYTNKSTHDHNKNNVESLNKLIPKRKLCYHPVYSVILLVFFVSLVYSFPVCVLKYMTNKHG